MGTGVSIEQKSGRRMRSILARNGTDERIVEVTRNVQEVIAERQRAAAGAQQASNNE